MLTASSEIVLRVEGVSKKYTVGTASVPPRGLRHVIEQGLGAPSLWLRNRLGAAPTGNEPASPFKREDESSQRSVSSEFYALKEASFDVARGDILGIVGPNGAGKSTLLKLLSRITEPTAGRIGIKGRMASLLEVGTGFHPELTGRENIFLNGAILGMTKAQIRRRFDDIAAFAEVDEFLDVPVKYYSSGMYVRLAFAVAAHLEAELLVVDEVLAVGDASFQKKCLGKMDEVAQSGRTVLLVSHNLGAVRRMCTAALWLDRGAIRARGLPAEVIASYIEAETRHRDKSPLRSGYAQLAIGINSGGTEGPGTVSMGKPMRIVASLSVDRPVRRAAVEIGIESIAGERVITFDSNSQHPHPWKIDRSARLVVDWPECILCPGIFRVVCIFYDNNHVAAVWHNAGDLTVLESDFFGTHRIPRSTYPSKVVTKAHWRIEETA